MTKQKTLEELEREYNIYKDLTFLGWFVAIICIMFLILLLIFPNLSDKYRELKQQLSECQDKVEVWTLKFVCIDVDEYSKITFEQNFTNYEDYKAGLELVGNKEYKLFENCEVISDD